MTEPAITPLRQRMLEDMAIRRLAPGTQAFYVSAVAKFARHFRRSPDALGYQEVRAYANKAVIYDALFKTASEALLRIAADPKHLGARIGLTAVLHTWGSALTHHPHVHCIVPGGGVSPDGARWISCSWTPHAAG